MVERVSSNAQDAYVKQRFAQLPSAQKGESHVIRSGESLWNIAKKELGNNAKNSEVNDYMLLLAKINGLDTTDKMNNIKVNTTIYLPKKTAEKPDAGKKPEAKQQQKPQVNPKKTNPKLPELKPQKQSPIVHPSDNTRVDRNPFITVPQKEVKPILQKPKPAKQSPKVAPKHKAEAPQVTQKPKQEAPKVEQKPVPKKNQVEQDFSERMNTVLNDKSVRVEDSHMYFIDRREKLYHVLNHYEKNGYISNSHPVMSVFINKDGVIEEVSFEGSKDLNPNGYDYDVKYDGKNPAVIESNPYLEVKGEKVGAVSQEDMQKLSNKLKSLIK